MSCGAEGARAKLESAFAAGEKLLDLVAPSINRRTETIERRVLEAFRSTGVVDSDLGSGTGYGYGDRAREATESVFALALEAERALVRPQIVSGTHALAIALLSCLGSGNLLLSLTGRPYDTLAPVIGPGPGSLAGAGVRYAEETVWRHGIYAPEAALAAARRLEPDVILIQRSRGYSDRPALTSAQLAELCGAIRCGLPASRGGRGPVILVDNCYAEFAEDREPTAYGAHLICGSLIKNPGGGIAPAGGYIAGQADLVESAAIRLFAPGLGSAVGPFLIPGRLLLQGLYLAPATVSTAIKVAHYAAAVFSALGFVVEPAPAEERTDIIQAIRLGRADLVETFCGAIQAWSPVDSSARPEFAAMPGYHHRVIMAAGTFVQGASLELSADAPDLEPYWVYLQGSLGLGYGKAAIEAAAEAVCARMACGDGAGAIRQGRA